MSVISAVRKNGVAVMASDSLVTIGEKRFPADNILTSKIRRVGAALIGSTGWSVYDDILNDFLANNDSTTLSLESRESIFSFFMALWKALHDKYPFVNDQCDDRSSPFGDLDSDFMVLNDSGIYLVSPDMAVTRFERYYAIGSGGAYALGSLHTLIDTPLDARELGQKSIETGIALNVHCGGPVDVVTLAQVN